MWNYNAGFLSLWMLNGVLIAGEEVAEALFSQSFSIGHRYPNPSSLWSSSSSPLSSFSSLTPLNTPASTTQQQPSFPGTGREHTHYMCSGTTCGYRGHSVSGGSRILKGGGGGSVQQYFDCVRGRRRMQSK